MIMRICFLLRLLFISLIAAVLFLSPCYADSGDTSIKIICDKKTDYLEVEPFIMWNEELEVFLKEYPRGTKKEGNSLTRVFDTADKTFKYSCKTDKRKITIVVDKEANLLIHESGALITKKFIDDVWFFSGPIFIMKSKKQGQWVECCGHKRGNPVSCKELTDSKTTNCKYR
jgi:hypothetical protein